MKPSGLHSYDLMPAQRGLSTTNDSERQERAREGGNERDEREGEGSSSANFRVFVGLVRKRKRKRQCVREIY
ncbi:hypothetical protein GQ457_02G007880 [Hibiscus cannabinus]